MDFANRGGNRTAGQQPAPQNDSASAAAPKFNNVRNKDKMDAGKTSSIFILIGTSILVLALIFALIFAKNENGFNSEKDLIEADRYQAVFLDSQDGQVYFGKLAVYNNDTYVLKDIYYVRVENPIQPDGGQAQQANISLAKLGNELHAPEDYMYIKKSQVLYWENLKDEGQVVNAIKEFKANGEQTPEQQPDAAGTQPAGTPQQNDTPAETPVVPTPDTGAGDTPATP